MTILTTLVANPRPGSRTHGLAALVAERVAGAIGGAQLQTVDLAALAPQLLEPGDHAVAAAREQVAGSDLLIVATPVYKATYTGLLKVFLDGYGPAALARVTAVGVVVSAAPAHLLATDIHLRSLLVELGAAVPAAGLGVTEAQLPEADALVDGWLTTSEERLRRLVGAGAPAPERRGAPA